MHRNRISSALCYSLGVDDEEARGLDDGKDSVDGNARYDKNNGKDDDTNEEIVNDDSEDYLYNYDCDNKKEGLLLS